MFIALLVCLGGQAVQAQGFVCSVGPGAMGRNPMHDGSPTPAAFAQMNHVFGLLCPTGCGNVNLVRNPTVSGAMMQVMTPGTSMVAYNPDFMNATAAQFGPGATFGIFAHELGHHLDFMINVAWMDHSWGRELRADAWAGCALARAGLSGMEMDGALQAIAAYPSSSHPGWAQRIVAVRTGYYGCGGNQWRQ
jgi:hypothetical protein